MSWLSQLLEKNSADPRCRLELGEKLLDQIGKQKFPSDARSLNDFCDVVFQWLGASNFKVSLLSLEIIHSAIDVAGDVLGPYVLERMSALIERLGDGKPTVREATAALIVELASVPHCSHQIVLEKVSPGINHKQFLVRVNTMNVYRMLLEEAHDELEIQTNRLIPTLCKLMADPNVEVRETAATTIVNIMFVHGDAIATSIQNRRLIPDSKMQALIQRYEEALRRGQMPSALPRPVRTGRSMEPRSMSATPTSTRNGSTSVTPSSSRNGFPLTPSSSKSTASTSRMSTSVSRNGTPGTMPMPPPTLPRRNEKREGTAAGAVCSEEIREAFTKVPSLNVTDSRSLNEQLNGITTILTNPSVDWSKRNNALKLIRSVCIAVKNTQLEDELVHRLNQMEEPLIASMKDLRSQVCKEAAISVCYLAVEFGTRLLKVFEALLPCCIALVPNSAKVMATSGSNACDYIIEYVESPKLIPTVVSSISSKAKEIRRQIQAMVLDMLCKWNSATFEKNIKSISEVVKAGINDADLGARQTARNSYQQLELNFPQVAQALYKSLDPARQKTVMGSMSAASSTQSISSLKDNAAMVRRPGTTFQGRQNAFFSGRSVSAIDPNAVKSLSRPKPISRSIRPPFAAAPSPATKPSPLKPLISSAKPSPARPSPVKSTLDEKKLFADIANLSLASDEEDFLSAGTEYDVQRAIRYCGATDIAEKRKGLKLFYDTFKAQKGMTGADCKKVNDALIKLLNEGNHKIITPLCETLCEFLAVYNSQTTEHMPFLLNRVLCKRSSELLPNSQASLDSVIKTIRTAFPADHQLYTLCNFIGGNHFTIQPLKAKEAIIHYLLDLFPLMAHNTALDRADVKAAISRIFQLIEDAKYGNIHPMCDELVAQFFNLNTPDFSTILATLPSNWKEYAYQLLNRKNEHSSSTSSPAVNHHSSAAPYSVATPPSSRYLLGSISMRDSNSTSPSAVEHFKNSSNTSVCSEPSVLVNETIHLGQNPGEQKEYLNRLMTTLSNVKYCNDNEEIEQCEALKSLTQMISEGSFTLWDSYFNLLLLKVFDGLENPRLPIKTQTLKLLNKLCVAQASKFYERSQAVILKVLSCSKGVKNDNNLWFFQALQDCLQTLATHLPYNTVLSVVNGIINEQNDERRCSALKMVTTLVKDLDQNQLEDLLPDIAPGIVRAYASEHSNERKSAIFALVEMVGRLGHPLMEPYLSELGKGRKILDVYLKRNQSGSQNF